MTRVFSLGPAAGAGITRFEIRDGTRRICCTVSEEVLRAASGPATAPTSASRRRSFDRFRTLIDAAAKQKLKTLPPGFTGPVVLSALDLRSVPPDARIPSFGNLPRGT